MSRRERRIVKFLFDTDQSQRFGNRWDDVARDDPTRSALAYLIAQRQGLDATTSYRLGMLLHHGERYRRASQVIWPAIGLHPKSGWLSQAVADRYLLSIGMPQKHGTQFHRAADGSLVLVTPASMAERRRLQTEAPN